VAGAIIFAEVVRRFGLDEVEVSEHDILRGAALNLSNNPKSGDLIRGLDECSIADPTFWGEDACGVRVVKASPPHT
jgi:hypothetical protein